MDRRLTCRNMRLIIYPACSSQTKKKDDRRPIVEKSKARVIRPLDKDPDIFWDI